jgi:hypothetical protein
VVLHGRYPVARANHISGGIVQMGFQGCIFEQVCSSTNSVEISIVFLKKNSEVKPYLTGRSLGMQR